MQSFLFSVFVKIRIFILFITFGLTKSSSIKNHPLKLSHSCLFIPGACPDAPTSSMSLEALPNELLADIYRRLPISDCLNVGATSHRQNRLILHEISGRLASLDTLVIEEPYFVSVDLIRRYVGDRITRFIVLIPGPISDQLSDYLETLVAVCPNVTTLIVKAFSKINSEGRKYRAALQRLGRLISRLPMKELGVDRYLRGILPSDSVETCTLDLSYVNSVAVAVADILRSPIFNGHALEDFRGFSTIDSLTLLCRKWFTHYPSILQLRQLTVRHLRDLNPFGRSHTRFVPASLFPSTLRCLTLDVPLWEKQLVEIFPHIPQLTHLTLRRLHTQPESVEHLTFEGLASLQELSLGGNTIVDECHLFRWAVERGCDRHSSLNGIFFLFDPQDWMDTLFTTPGFPLNEISRFRPGVLRNLFFFLETPESWVRVNQLLAGLESLNELWLLFHMDEGWIKWDPSLIQPVPCRISKLMLADNLSQRNDSGRSHYTFHQHCFAILSRFLLVSAYHLCVTSLLGDGRCDTQVIEDASFWQAHRDPTSTVSLHIRW